MNMLHSYLYQRLDAKMKAAQQQKELAELEKQKRYSDVLFSLPLFEKQKSEDKFERCCYKAIFQPARNLCGVCCVVM